MAVSDDDEDKDAKKTRVKGKSDSIMDDPEASRRMCRYWKTHIEACDKENEKWHKKGADVLKRFRDERDKAAEQGQRKFNILWANFKILKPALYAKKPLPIVERRFLDHDPKGRTSAMILERSLRNEIELNGYHTAISMAVDDRLLPGRGQVWVRYEPEIGESVSIPGGGKQDMVDDQGDIIDIPDDEETDKLEETGEELISETVPVDHVNWRDFYTFPAKARTWAEVQAVGKRVFMSKEQCIDRFGEEIGEKIEADTSLMSESEKVGLTDTAIIQDIYERQRIIFEIWNKVDRRAYWISTGYDKLCDAREDPLKLTSFFPCPEPLCATMTSETVIPVPDYHEYQDQAIQLDELSDRIAKLSTACKVAGVYDASARGNRGGLDRLLDEAVENQLIPIESFAAFKEKGGLAGCIDFLPLDVIVKALQVLTEVRQRVMEDLDRISMINDVMRGTTDARETMGAQRLKSNSSSTRIEDERAAVAKFATDVLRIVAEVMCKHFGDKTLIEASGIFHEEGIASLLEQLGIGLDDIDKLDEFGGGMSPMLPSAALAPPQPPVAALPPPSMPTPQPGMPPGAPPMQPPGGQNVVPLRPQMQGMPAPGGPQPPNAAQGVPPQPQAMQAPKPSLHDVVRKVKGAIDLLRKDIKRGYRIDIETDSMIGGDILQERQDAIQFVEGMLKFMQGSEMVAAQQPQAIPMLGKMMQFAVRKFRGGRDLEQAVDEYVDKVDKMAQASAGHPKPPSPEQIKAQTEQAKSQAEIAKAKLDAQTDQQSHAQDAQLKQMEFSFAQKRMQDEVQMHEREMQIKLQGMEREEAMRNAEHQRKMQQMAIQAAMPKPIPTEAAE